MRALSRTDRVTLAYVLGLGLLAAAGCAEPAPLLLGLAALATAVRLVHELATRWPSCAVLRDFFPVLSVICLFEWTGPVIAAWRPTLWDGWLAEVDARWFRALQASWFGVLGRPWWLTDLASLVYVSYYVLPVAIGVALYRAGRRADFDAFVFTVVGTLLVTYASYFAMPAVGPRVPSEQAAAVVGGGPVSAAFRTFLPWVEGNLLDAFPSGHTTVSLVCLVAGWRLLPRWRVPLVLVVAGIVFSTVYLSLHYVIDVLAGVAMALGLGVLAGLASLPALAFDVGVRQYPARR